MGPRADLDLLANTEISTHVGNQTPIFQPVAGPVNMPTDVCLS